MRNKIKPFAVLILLGLLIVAIIFYGNQPDSINADEAFSSTQEIISTNTESILPTYTPTVMQTSTNTPTYTPTPSITPTWTPVPKLSEEEAFEKTWELLETNGNCNYPCWWGMTPGKDTYSAATIFFSELAHDLKYREDEKRGAMLSGKINVEHPEVRGVLVFRILESKADKNILGGIRINGYLGPLSNILEKLGPPEIVYFKGPLQFPEGYRPEVMLSFYYPSIQTLIMYSGLADLDEEKNTILCDFTIDPNDWDASISLSFWEPDRATSHSDTLNLFSDENPLNHASIDQISNMDAKRFYEVFSLDNSDECLIIDTFHYGELMHERHQK